MLSRILLTFTLLLIYNSKTLAQDGLYQIDDVLKINTLDDIDLLTYTLYHENRGSSDLSQMMVLATIFNRVNSDRFPNTVHKVVTQKHQFSYLYDGRSDKIVDIKTYKHLHKLVEDFILNKEMFLKLSEGSLFYHTTGVNPIWNRNMKLIGQFDDHLFYKEK